MVFLFATLGVYHLLRPTELDATHLAFEIRVRAGSGQVR